MVQFRVRLAGLMPTDDRWRNFYKKNQQFVTLCKNCIVLKEIRKFLDASKGTKYCKKGSTVASFLSNYKDQEGKPKRLVKDMLKSETNGKLKAILYHILTQARSNLLHLRKNENDNFEVELANRGKKEKNDDMSSEMDLN